MVFGIILQQQKRNIQQRRNHLLKIVLKNFHQSRDVASRMWFREQFASFKFASRNMEAHVGELEALVMRMESAGCPVNPEDVCATLLRSLPPSYDGLVQAGCQRSPVFRPGKPSVCGGSATKGSYRKRKRHRNVGGKIETEEVKEENNVLPMRQSRPLQARLQKQTRIKG